MPSVPVNQRLSIEDAARIYNQAVAQGKPGSREVMIQGNISYSTALEKIRTAKFAGLIEEGGIAYSARLTGRNAKALAICKELDIDYDKFLAALGKHAKGRLIVSMAKCQSEQGDA